MLISAADPQSSAVIYIDPEDLEPYLKVVLEVVSMTAPEADLQKLCGFQPLLHVQDAVLSIRRAKGESSAIIRTRGSPKAALECFETALPGELQGFVRGEYLVLADSTAAAEAAHRRLEKALAAAPSERSTRLARLSRGDVRFDYDDPGSDLVLAATGDLDFRADGIQIDFTARLRSEEMARGFETEAVGLRAELASNPALPESVAASVRHVLETLRVVRKGSEVHVTLSAPNHADQPAKLAMGLATGIAAARRYVLTAKLNEARAVVVEIAKRFAASSAESGKRIRFPDSAPPVPSAVPTGRKDYVRAADWSHSTWRAVGFDYDGPLYYSYSIETAPDHRSATVRARGDLDGDGVLSNFELQLRVVTRAGVDSVVIDEKLVETNPEE